MSSRAPEINTNRVKEFVLKMFYKEGNNHVYACFYCEILRITYFSSDTIPQTLEQLKNVKILSDKIIMLIIFYQVCLYRT